VTAAMAAKPLADAQLEAHAILCPRQISQGALIGLAAAGKRKPTVALQLR
jgi:hypothetical protein